SLTLLILGPLAAYRAAGRFAALLTAALLAVSARLMKFAGELKQYSVEAAIAAALLLLGNWLYGRLTSAAPGDKPGPPGRFEPSGRAGSVKQAVRFGVVRHGEVIRPAGTWGLAITWIGLTMIAVLF